MPILPKPSPSRNGLSPSSPLLSSSFTDIKEAGGLRKRKIGGTQHHKNSAGLWVKSDTIARQVTMLPPQWPLVWNPAVRIGGESITYVTGTDQGGWLSKVAHQRDLWVSIQPSNRLPGVVPTRNKRTFRWNNVFPDQGTLAIRVGKKGYRKVISYPSMPITLPQIDVAVPVGCTIVKYDNHLKFLNVQGDEYMHTKPAFGWWGADRLEGIEDVAGAGVGSISLVQTDTYVANGVTWHTYELTPVGPEWDNAQGVVRFDPSTEISGATDVDMTHIIEGYSDYNYGTDTRQDVEYESFSSGRRHMLLRADADLYPDGTYTDCSWDLYWRSGEAGAGDGTHHFHRIVDDNSAWIQGVNNHWRSTGDSTWNNLAWDSTTPTKWFNGSDGFVIGTDTDSASGLDWVHTVGVHDGQYNSHSLPTSWFSDWAATPANNAGVYITEDTGSASDNLVAMDADNGTNPPTLTITYTTGGSAPTFFFMMGF